MALLSSSASPPESEKIYDYIIIGSGFGGSVAAMRLSEKGYSVLVLEQGRKYRAQILRKTIGTSTAICGCHFFVCSELCDCLSLTKPWS